jgi:hypothetical protein
MRLLALCLVLLLLPRPVAAQGFVLRPQVDLTYITNTLGGYDYDLRAVEADPAPGKEVLFWVPGLWMFTVGRWHPTKRGVYGAIAGPGLCLEPWTYIVPRGSVWHFAAIGDLYGGDGIDDYLVYLTSGQVDPYQGLGLTVCK